ncbi:MAG: ABC transporter ATP-binding protein [Inconstantimicrobium porci]|uniref:ABC transporter ATP-binding protein n=1 Tax=Inconstantimicrobium porci TaxID=2652291 RepID=UPI00240A5AE0|nr:ABC transporter ATP-binding protein [Inconstantimicrobium porci]MDD6770575.1 ABC transporter ATP-binding protein [Inconstantimicrobium porci]MDY5912627.1 ABC transporter ATP-binding protein [Inconstantimicrobium porci]
MNKVLEVKDVKKKLGKREIIKGLTFDVNEGEIFGFLGPNGAGKTTTIRMLVDLIHPDSGEIKILGHDVKKDKVKALENVGAVVENPELYKYLSGRENLMQIARVRKIPKAEVQEIIELVGLKDRINDKVKKYSLGMKQRLGLGASLLGNPKLIILDEPTNGLDPSGIMDFREIVRKAAKERGVAVFISSHILSEVQQICDRVAFINNGVIQSVESMDEDFTTETDTLVISTVNDEETLNILNTIDIVKDSFVAEGKITVQIAAGVTPQLVKVLVEKNVEINEVYKKHEKLEQRYMELVEGGAR